MKEKPYVRDPQDLKPINSYDLCLPGHDHPEGRCEASCDDGSHKGRNGGGDIAKPAASKGRRYSKDERKTILEAVAQGKSWADILSQYGPRHETVTRWQRREAYKYPEKQVVEIAVADENLKKEFSGSNKHWREG